MIIVRIIALIWMFLCLAYTATVLYSFGISLLFFGYLLAETYIAIPLFIAYVVTLINIGNLSTWIFREG